MCGLCGLLGIVHWTEMSAHPDAFTGGGRPTVRAERIRRTGFVNGLLQPLRMKVADFQATSYVLASATGKREIVDDLAGVWSTVEQLGGRPVDPLDPTYLAALSQVQR